MTTALADWKSGARQRIVWVDYERYTSRVFSGSPTDWYRNPVRFAAAISQAHRVVPSDVVAIDALAPFLDRWSGDVAGATDGSAVQDVLALVDERDAQSFLAEVIDALVHSLGDEVDFVLKLRSPRDLLLAVGAPPAAASDFDALDTVGTALVGLVRQLSGKAFSGLQVCSDHANGLSADEQEACEPIFRAAAYYGWMSCATYGKVAAGMPAWPGLDLLLFPELPEAAILAAGCRNLGGGLNAAFWGDGGEIPQQLPVLHGVIPELARPETVAERMRMIAGLAFPRACP